MFEPQDHYFFQAKKLWYLARSVFKLEEIDNRFNIINKNTKNIIDIWCAPGSRIQYAHKKINTASEKKINIIWFDLKKVNLNLENVYTYQQNIQDSDSVLEILNQNKIERVDLIMSDMAPDTIWNNTADAIRSIELIKSCIWIYQKFIWQDSKFIIKVFMWPGFEELYKYLKDSFWWPKAVKIFKPKASRKESKETYIIKI